MCPPRAYSQSKREARTLNQNNTGQESDDETPQQHFTLPIAQSVHAVIVNNTLTIAHNLAERIRRAKQSEPPRRAFAIPDILIMRVCESARTLKTE